MTYAQSSPLIKNQVFILINMSMSSTDTQEVISKNFYKVNKCKTSAFKFIPIKMKLNPIL